MALLTVKQAAQKLSVTPDLIYREIKAGNLTAYRIGTRTIRIYPEDLQEYQARQKITVERMEVI